MSVETETDEVETTEPEELEDGLQTEETEASEEVTEEPAAEEEGEMVVTLGDAEPEEPEDHADSPVLRTVRQKLRETQRELREMRAKMAPQQAEQVPVVGKKPSLDDFDYDTDKFEAALVSWHESKRRVDEHVAKQRQAMEEQQREWDSRLQHYTHAKQALKVRDFDDAEAAAQEAFNVTQQGIILHGSANPALLVYALGKNTAKAKEVAAIKDPVKFAFAIARLETELKTTQRKPATAPERVPASSGGAGVSSANKQLEALRAEAAKTGDRSKVVAYMRKMSKS